MLSLQGNISPDEVIERLKELRGSGAIETVKVSKYFRFTLTCEKPRFQISIIYTSFLFHFSCFLHSNTTSFMSTETSSVTGKMVKAFNL